MAHDRVTLEEAEEEADEDNDGLGEPIDETDEDIDESFEESEQRRQEETPEEEEHTVGQPNYGAREARGEEDIDVQSLEEKFEDVETIAVSPPTSLGGRGTGGGFGGGGELPPVRQPPDDGEDVNVNVRFEEGETIVDVPAFPEFPELDVDFPEIPEFDTGDLESFEELQIEVMRRMLQRLVNIQVLGQIFTRAAITSAITQLDILDFTRPGENIVITGENALDAVDTPEPVVPNTDEVSVPTRKLYIKASSNNNAEIAFGDNKVNPNSGFILRPGESIMLDIDLRGEPIYMASRRNGQTVELFGML